MEDPPPAVEWFYPVRIPVGSFLEIIYNVSQLGPWKDTRMAKHKKIIDPKEKENVGSRTHMAAEAHRLASDSCLRDSLSCSDSDPYDFYLKAVSFESLLVSVEQSLRLLLLLRFSLFPENPDHNLSALYKKLEDESGGDEWIFTEIIQRMNDFIRRENMISLISGKDLEEDIVRLISREELKACLERHCSSYSNIKYFQVNRQGKLNKEFEFSNRERWILYCFAVALIELNELGLGALSLIIRKPESGEEITEEELELAKKRFLPADT